MLGNSGRAVACSGEPNEGDETEWVNCETKERKDEYDEGGSVGEELKKVLGRKVEEGPGPTEEEEECLAVKEDE